LLAVGAIDGRTIDEMTYCGQLPSVTDRMAVPRRCHSRAHKVQAAYTVLRVKVVTARHRNRHAAGKGILHPPSPILRAAFGLRFDRLVAREIVRQELPKLHEQYVTRSVRMVQIGKQRGGQFASRWQITASVGDYPWRPDTVTVRGRQQTLHRVSGCPPEAAARFDVVAAAIKATIARVPFVARRTYQAALWPLKVFYRRSV